MIDEIQTHAVRPVLGVGHHVAGRQEPGVTVRGVLGAHEAVGDTHLHERRVAREREQCGQLGLPPRSTGAERGHVVLERRDHMRPTGDARRRVVRLEKDVRVLDRLDKPGTEHRGCDSGRCDIREHRDDLEATLVDRVGLQQRAAEGVKRIEATLLRKAEARHEDRARTADRVVVARGA